MAEITHNLKIKLEAIGPTPSILSTISISFNLYVENNPIARKQPSQFVFNYLIKHGVPPSIASQLIKDTALEAIEQFRKSTNEILLNYRNEFFDEVDSFLVSCNKNS